MQALILAGGFGTRLRSVVSEVPKPMADIAGKPFLDYLVSWLIEQNIITIKFLTGYKSEIIEDYFKNLNIGETTKAFSFSKEEKAFGTAGAIFNIWNKLDDSFMVLNGDAFFDIDLSIIVDYARKHGSTIALCYSKDLLRYGLVDINDDYTVRHFIEKGKDTSRYDCYINSGIYCINKSDLLPFYNAWNGDFLSLENDIFPKLLEKQQLYGLPIDGYFIDIGIPDDYKKAVEIIPQKVKEIRKPALFLDRDNVLIDDKEDYIKQRHSWLLIRDFKLEGF